MVQTAETIFRDFETDGVPASGKHKPKKSEIRPYLTWLESTSEGVGFQYAFSSTTTDADPGSGTFRLNNVTPASATEAYIDDLDGRGFSAGAIIDTWDDSTSTIRGVLTIRGATDPSVRYQFNVTGSVVDGTGYRKVTLAYVAGEGTFVNGDSYVLTFQRTGDVGQDGDVTTNDDGGLTLNTSGVPTQAWNGPFGGTWDAANLFSSDGADQPTTGSYGTLILKRLTKGDGSNGPSNASLTLMISNEVEDWKTTANLREADVISAVSRLSKNGDGSIYLFNGKKVFDPASPYGMTGVEGALYSTDGSSDIAGHYYGIKTTVGAVLNTTDIRNGGVAFMARALVGDVAGGSPAIGFLLTGDGAGSKWPKLIVACSDLDPNNRFFQLTSGADGATAQMHFGTPASEMVLRYSGGLLQFMNTGATASRINFAETGGVYHPNATGGNKGNGTINMTAVYDDNVLLTDYVFDRWLGREGVYSERVREKAAALDASMFDLATYIDYSRSNGRLWGMPDLDDVIDGAVKEHSLGAMIQKLWQTAEIMSIHDAELLGRVVNLEERLAA